MVIGGKDPLRKIGYKGHIRVEATSQGAAADGAQSVALLRHALE
jgi:hypothetical protein